MSVHGGPKIIPKTSDPLPTAELNHHPSYDRIHEAWRASRDEGSFNLRDFVSSPAEPLHISCERLVEVLGDAQHDSSDFGAWVFTQGATILAEVEPDASYIDNNDFSHTAKYLFVGSCFSSSARSVLDQPESRPLAERLVNRVVSFCDRSQSLGTAPLLIKGIIASNVRVWADTGDLSSFVCKPHGLTSKEFQTLINHASDVEARKLATASKPITGSMATIQRFCSADSPVDFLLWAFSNNVALPVSEKAPQLRRALAAHLGQAADRFPFLVDVEARAASSREDLTPRPVPELREGVYVDVFGTLIHHDGSPNLRLAQVITDLRRQVPPPSVFLVSDSQDEEIERALAFLNPLPPIVHKDRLEGCELEYLIDNSEPGPQGFRARTYLSPDRATELADLLQKSKAQGGS